MAASASGTSDSPSPLAKPERALAKDAAAQARQLKRKHRALYTADPMRFRKIVRLGWRVSRANRTRQDLLSGSWRLSESCCCSKVVFGCH
jgi:hypothetical protein